jgi:hypothetical protein
MAELTAPRVAHWPDGARSPLNLMIDDLADVLIPLPGHRRREQDWGHLGRGPDSAWRFVEERILDAWPRLHVSLFIPVNRRPLVEPPPGSRFAAIDSRPEMVDFLRALAAHPRLECAYHGKDHFLGAGAARRQEWLCHASVAAAVAETRAGLEIWGRVFGRPPLGGKYPGYAANEHGDASLETLGFRWWCRRFNRGPITSLAATAAELAPRWFAGGELLDLPSTMAGNVLPPLLHGEWLKRPKRLWQRRRLLPVLRRQIAQLLEAGLPITIQEHIAPSREDGQRQRNNIQDDLESLGEILALAERGALWHAHLSEIADHVRLRERTVLRLENGALHVDAPRADMLATLELELREPRIVAFVAPDGRRAAVRDTPRGRFCALPLAHRVFQVEEVAA